MPTRIKFHFDPEKAVEVILYVASRVRDSGFHRVSKILYFADRDHLAMYGRFICGDSYVAMKNGPVPSGAYDADENDIIDVEQIAATLPDSVALLNHLANPHPD